MKAIIITYNDSYDFDTRTKYVANYFLNKGIEVGFVISDFNHRTKKRYESGRENTIYISVPKYKKNISLGRLFSCYVFSKRVRKYIKEHPADYIYHCAPPNCTIRELSKIKKDGKWFLITEIGDMWPESFPVSRKMKKMMQIPFSLWKNLRNRYLYNSDFVITECNLFKKYLQEHVKKQNIETLYFCKEWKGNNRKLNIEDEISVCYLGSINNIIDINIFKQLVQELAKHKKVIIHIIGDGEKRGKLLKSLSYVEHVEVKFHGIIFDEEKKENIFNKCHFALNIMKEDVFVGMTMKSLDYFAYGIPMINNIRGDIWSLIDKERVGFNISLNTIPRIAKQISSLDNVSYGVMQKNVKNIHGEYFSIDAFNSFMDKVMDGFDEMKR